MKILHRFMIRQFLVPFTGAYIIVVFAFLMQFAWKYIDDFVGKGLELSVIGEFFLYITPHISSSMAFPLAVLLASIFTMGSLGENYELIALKAAGISLRRIILPLIIVSFVISVGAFFFANNVTPVAFLKWRQLISDIHQKRPELSIPEGVFYSGIDGYSIRFDRRDHKTNMLHDLMIYTHTSNAGNVQVTVADSGQMVMTADKTFLELTLYHGNDYRDVAENRRSVSQERNFQFQRHSFDRQLVRIELPAYDLERSNDEYFKSGSQMLNVDQLTFMIDSLTAVVDSQATILRNTVQTVYHNPAFKSIPVDTSLRAKVPDDFRNAFNEKSKAQRQSAIQDALSDVRAQKERIDGMVYEIGNRNRMVWGYEIERHKKFTLSLACMILFFIGTPLGAIIRKGGLGTPIIIAVIFFVIYYVISMIGEKSAREGAMSSIGGMWLSTFIILTVGIFLTWMATRDSSIFNQELYANWIRKGLNFIFTTSRKQRPEAVYAAAPADLAPERMISSLEELSHCCKTYMEGNFRKRVRLRGIWYDSDNTGPAEISKRCDSDNAALAEIGRRYDSILTVLRQSDVEMIRESVEEYPHAALHNYRIRRMSHLLTLAVAVVFPVWIYLYLKTCLQKNSLRSDLKNIIRANRNLVNELNSIL